MKNKFKQITLLSLLTFTSIPVFAATESSSFGIGLSTIIYIFAFILLLIGIAIFRIAVHLKRYTDNEFGEKSNKKSTWETILQLKSIDSDKDTIINHGHDGIYELDNPPPPWFMFLFYFTIVFAIVYFFRFIVLDTAYTQIDEYKIEVANANEAKKLQKSNNPKDVEVESIELKQDEATLTAGKTVFLDRCSACHGQYGEGVIGPAFVDDNWIHDCDINGVYKSIKYGYMSKGMQAWKGTLTPDQIKNVTNFVYSLRGKSLPEGKVVKKPKEGDNPCVPKEAEINPTIASDSIPKN